MSSTTQVNSKKMENTKDPKQTSESLAEESGDRIERSSPMIEEEGEEFATARLPSSNCEMCANYETTLTRLQESERSLREQLAAAQELASRYENELSAERRCRRELESRLSTLSVETELKVRACVEENSQLEQKLQLLAGKMEADLNTLEQELKAARDDVKRFEMDMLALNARYEKLLALNRQKAQEMREQEIELPQTVEQLQFFALQLREQLIEARAAYEHGMEEWRLQREEYELTREYLLEVQLNQQQRGSSQGGSGGDSPSRRSPSLQLLVEDGSNPNGELHTTPPLQRRQREGVGESTSSQRGAVTQLEQQMEGLQLALNNYKTKCAQLQQELDTCETVQKDFVQLSQSLQIQLEKIRQAEQEVRWQWDDDVAKCNRCEATFQPPSLMPRRSSPQLAKLHCMHCGKIFCADCLQHTINSGPNHRPAKVCEVCHTLLNRESRPFFSASSDQG